LEADDSLQVHGIHALPRDVFWAGLANKLQTWWNPGQRNMFVLIHGFNVSFEEAATRAAQIGYDLKVPGEIAFYSWPSHGSGAAYSADEATITASVPHIAQFLHELSERSGAERIHLFVHSMGNRGFLSALQDIVADRRPNLRLGQVFFCAPDEDVRTFRNKVNKYRLRCAYRMRPPVRCVRWVGVWGFLQLIEAFEQAPVKVLARCHSDSGREAVAPAGDRGQSLRLPPTERSDARKAVTGKLEVP